MQPNEYQQLALRTEHTDVIMVKDLSVSAAPSPIPLSRLMHGALGICTESGELQDALKKHLIYGKPLDMVNIMEECGDVLWYIAVALDAAGFTMQECMERNIEKLRKRFPEKFTQARALVRDLDGERAALEGNPKP